LVKTSVIVAPLCAVVLSPPTEVFDVACQEYVVPTTVEVSVTPVAFPEQIVCGLGVAVATGAVHEHEGEAMFVSMAALQIVWG
jgi:hypothetical protein